MGHVEASAGPHVLQSAQFLPDTVGLRGEVLGLWHQTKMIPASNAAWASWYALITATIRVALAAAAQDESTKKAGE
jgi:hypothetical protein